MAFQSYLLPDQLLLRINRRTGTCTTSRDSKLAALKAIVEYRRRMIWKRISEYAGFNISFTPYCNCRQRIWGQHLMDAGELFSKKKSGMTRLHLFSRNVKQGMKQILWGITSLCLATSACAGAGERGQCSCVSALGRQARYFQPCCKLDHTHWIQFK